MFNGKRVDSIVEQKFSQAKSEPDTSDVLLENITLWLLSGISKFAK